MQLIAHAAQCFLGGHDLGVAVPPLVSAPRVATGWGRIAAASTEVFVIDQVQHDWLFPRMSAVAHHGGGGGTTAAALAAGVPQVVCPFVADQRHWTWRMHALGVAPEPLRQQQLTAAGRAAAIGRAVELRERAQEVEREICAENGVEASVRALAEIVHNGRDD